ncbi:acyltransferase [Microbacterium sp. lyk4-40-TSB-66]|uniref:acyltransferase family protein n=1 Tax=Microbacterium sp. lyk4-40-TSB-66 TaxID=3040294 RepID=UPI00254C2EEE|nr:acyltransferase [Microbacterium sp. lyk4-40-TSB-66]
MTHTLETSWRRFRDTTRLLPLDGLRAVAILLVFTGHVEAPGPWKAVHGGVGVTLFFVISGFIITTLLLRESDERPVDFGAFYIRRAFRILPMYLLVLAVYCVLILVLGTQEDRRAEFLNALPGYLMGFPEIVQLTNTAEHQAPFSGAWSIGIEDKFYLVWPVVGFLLLRRRWTALIPLLLVSAGILTVVGFGTPVARVLQPYVHIILGVLVAVGLHYRGSFGVLARLFGRWWLTWALLAVSLALVLYPDIALGTPLYVPYGLLWAVTIVSLFTAPPGAATTVLSSRPLLFIGTVSYSFYLTHAFVLNALEKLPPAIPSWAQYPLGLAGSLVLAWATYRLVESPMNRWGHRIAARRRARRTPAPSASDVRSPAPIAPATRRDSRPDR